MWPPSAVETAVMRSPGLTIALSAAMFATVPEIGWMLAKFALKTFLAKSIPMVSMVSKSSQPW